MVSIEESRLELRLPDEDDPTGPQPVPFASQMILGGGFEDVAPVLQAALDTTATADEAEQVVTDHGLGLWRAAIDRAQGRVGRGDLPPGDDRPLYWTRLLASTTIRHWTPGFDLDEDRREGLLEAFDRASRGAASVDFPDDGVRILVSGFDPYTLDGGATGPAAETAGNNLRHGNPSGAAALALHGTEYVRSDGRTVRIQAYVLPVSYSRFARGYLEDTVGPWMRPGPQRLHASITVSQGSGSQFNLEEYNARYHAGRADNDGEQPAPSTDADAVPADSPEVFIQVPQRWGGPEEFDLHDPPQWTRTSLPVEAMITARTGADVPRPAASRWPETDVAYGVVWNTRFEEIPDPAHAERAVRNDPVPHEFPPPEPPVAPGAGSISYRGGGGNYLSNESAYRNTLLRDRLSGGAAVAAGHIHTPDMHHFATQFGGSDELFEETRQAIVTQTAALVRAAAERV